MIAIARLTSGQHQEFVLDVPEHYTPQQVLTEFIQRMAPSRFTLVKGRTGSFYTINLNLIETIRIVIE